MVSWGNCFSLCPVPVGCCFSTLFFKIIICTNVRYRGKANNTPVTCSLMLRVCRFQFVALAASWFVCPFVHVCYVSKYVLAACSRCDRWSTAYAQINRPILMKSRFCLLSHSLLTRSRSFSSVTPFILQLNHGHVEIQRGQCRTREMGRDRQKG